MPMTDTTTSQEMKDIVSPTMGHYNQQIIWGLDSTTLLPTGVKHEIVYPATVLPTIKGV